MIISLFNEYWLHVGFFWALTIACWLLSGGLEKRNGFPWRVCFSVAAFHIMGYFGMPWLTRINIQLIQWTGLPGIGFASQQVILWKACPIDCRKFFGGQQASPLLITSG